MPTLTFNGAARQVTGSCYLLETQDNFRFLLECGMHQGEDVIDVLQSERFGFEAASIDALILSHAHLDHSGLLPLLAKIGFRGPVYCTTGTLKLLPILLYDSVSLYESDLKRKNKQRKEHGDVELEAAYSSKDVEQILSQCVASRYGELLPIHKDLRLKFHDAGHILGSAIVELIFTENGKHKTLVFSGDLGNPDSVLMKNPTLLESADLLMMEATYGDRNHRDMKQTLEQFEQILHETWQAKGNVMIPAFAVGRTQEVLFHLGCLHHQGILDQWQIFLDSPMAIDVTEVYDECMQLLDPDDVKKLRIEGHSGLQNFLPQLTFTDTVEASQAINEVSSGAIIIAGSGMCTGGRIRHHLRYRLADSRNTLIFTGFQAQGTLGRILVNGVKTIRLFKEDINVAARIETLGGFSAHAGQRELIEWLRHFHTKPRLILIHGEEDTLQTFADKLSRDFQIQAEIPALGEQISF